MGCWIVWEISCFCSRWISIQSSLNPIFLPPRQVRRDCSLVSGPRFPRIPLPLNPTGDIPLCLNPLGIHNLHPQPRHRISHDLTYCWPFVSADGKPEVTQADYKHRTTQFYIRDLSISILVATGVPGTNPQGYWERTT